MSDDYAFAQIFEHQCYFGVCPEGVAGFGVGIGLHHGGLLNLKFRSWSASQAIYSTAGESLSQICRVSLPAAYKHKFLAPDALLRRALTTQRNKRKTARSEALLTSIKETPTRSVNKAAAGQIDRHWQTHTHTYTHTHMCTHYQCGSNVQNF